MTRPRQVLSYSSTRGPAVAITRECFELQQRTATDTDPLAGIWKHPAVMDRGRCVPPLGRSMLRNTVVAIG